MSCVHPFICLPAAGMATSALGPVFVDVIICFSGACGFPSFWLPSGPIPEQGCDRKSAPRGLGGSFQLPDLASPLQALLQAQSSRIF